MPPDQLSWESWHSSRPGWYCATPDGWTLVVNLERDGGDWLWSIRNLDWSSRVIGHTRDATVAKWEAEAAYRRTKGESRGV